MLIPPNRCHVPPDISPSIPYTPAMSLRSVSVAVFLGAMLLVSACGGSSESSNSNTTPAAVDRQAASSKMSYVTLNNQLSAWWTGGGIPITWVVSETNNESWGGSKRADHAPPEGIQGLEQSSPSSYTAELEVNTNRLKVPRFTLTPTITVDGQQFSLEPVDFLDYHAKGVWSVDVNAGTNWCESVPLDDRRWSVKTPSGLVQYQYDLTCGNTASVTISTINR